jgi:hypothetical protein
VNLEDGGIHTWDVDATAAGGGMTRSVVRRSYLRLLARARRPTCNAGRLLQRRTGSGLRIRSPARHEAANAQFRARTSRRPTWRAVPTGQADTRRAQSLAYVLRSFDPVDSPSRGGKCAVPVSGLRGRQSVVVALPVDEAGRFTQYLLS